jgi:hypothetical protein
VKSFSDVLENFSMRSEENQQIRGANLEVPDVASQSKD